jgi:predicted lipase
MESYTIGSTIHKQQPLLGNNTNIYTRGSLRAFPSSYSMLSYRNKMFQLLNIYYNKYLIQIDKSESSIYVLQYFSLKKNSFPHRSYATAQPLIIKDARKSKYSPYISLTHQLWNSKYLKIRTNAPNCPPLYASVAILLHHTHLDEKFMDSYP